MKSSAPVLLCSVTGYDASGKVDDLAAELGKGLTSIAIGIAKCCYFACFFKLISTFLSLQDQQKALIKQIKR